MSQFVSPRIGALAAALLAISCDGEPVSPQCAEARDHSDLAWIQEKIFTPSCANFASCHQGQAASAARLNLEAGTAQQNLVNRPASHLPDQTLVVPGRPQQSYLMVMLGSYEGPLPAIGTMPPSTMPLCVEKRDAIERWITSLAAAGATPQ